MILANTEYSLEGLMLNLKLKYFGHLMRRASSLEKTDTGKDWKQEEKGESEDEMFVWYHRLNGHEFEQIPGDNEAQGSQVCNSPQSMGSQIQTKLSKWTK